MKAFVKFFLSILFLVSASVSKAQTEQVDTLLKVGEPSQLVIIENANSSKIKVKSLNGDGVDAIIETPFSSNSSVTSSQSTFRNSVQRIVIGNEGNSCSSNRWDLIMDGVCIGMNKALGQPEPGNLQWSKSFEISWLNCLGVVYELGASTSISLGLGFDWRNYRSTLSSSSLTATTDKGIEWAKPLSSGSTVRFSRLKIFSLQLPLLLRTKIPSTSLYFKMGPILNFNTYGSLKTVYDDADGNKREVFTKNINPRRVTVDFYGSISLCKAVGVYVRYSPMKVMESSSPINFHPLSLGITLGI